jgi:hypothetical protein
MVVTGISILFMLCNNHWHGLNYRGKVTALNIVIVHVVARFSTTRTCWIRLPICAHNFLQSWFMGHTRKYVHKRKLRANLFKTEITTSQGAKGTVWFNPCWTSCKSLGIANFALYLGSERMGSRWKVDGGTWLYMSLWLGYGHLSYPLSPQKRVLKQSVCSELGINWLKWDE